MEILSKYNFEYIDGDGNKKDNLYDVGINVLLVLGDIRLSFMLQEVDYSDEKMFQKVLKTVMDTPNIISIKIDQGFVVFKINNFDTVSKLLKKYEKSDDYSYLGEVLSYPCMKDFDPSIEQRFYSIYIEASDTDILTNACKSVRKFERMYRKIKEYLKPILPDKIVKSIVLKRY